MAQGLRLRVAGLGFRELPQGDCLKVKGSKQAVVLLTDLEFQRH